MALYALLAYSIRVWGVVYLVQGSPEPPADKLIAPHFLFMFICLFGVRHYNVKKMKLFFKSLRVFVLGTIFLIGNNNLDAQIINHLDNPIHDYTMVNESYLLSEVSEVVSTIMDNPAEGELKVLAEFIRPGMRYNPLNNQKYGGCMLRIRKVANNDGSQVHYDISGYAVDQVGDQWIWHDHLSNSVKYDSVKGVYTAFVSGLGNVYFSI